MRKTDTIEMAVSFTHTIVDNCKIDNLDDANEILKVMYEVLSGPVKEIVNRKIVKQLE